MKTFLFSGIVIILAACAGEKEKTALYDDALLQRIRTAANAVPDSAPLSIGYIKYAESRRKCSDLVEGENEDTCIMARTAFQIVYPDGWIMVDAGMDRAMHRFF